MARASALSKVRDLLLVEPKSTLEVETDCLRFLASFDGREVFQRVERNETLDFVINVLRKRDALRFQALAEDLASSQNLEATVAEACTYIDSLLRAGLLRFCSVVAEQ